MAKVSGEEVTSQLNKSGCSCLNEDQRYPHKNLFLGGGEVLPLKSDVDPELILQLSFMQSISLTTIVIGLPENDSCPKTIKLFCNRCNMGFDEAKDINPVQTIDIEQGVKTVTVNLLATKWTRTDTITLFVEENHGGDVTELHSLRFFGKPLMGTDVSQIKKC
jgi:hypothetical protein